MPPSIATGRRRLLVHGGAGLAALSLAGLQRAASAAGEVVPPPKALPAYATGKDAAGLVVHSATTIETRRSAFGAGVVTPESQLYIRDNLPPPDASIVADRDAWTVAFEGVGDPRRLTVRELKGLGLETLAMVLQCSGNGRGFFPDKPSGTPWQVGAAGCVVWTGVPLRDVVAFLGGVAPGMNWLTGTGGEVLPQGIDPKSVIVERSVPASAMADAMLAWELNGAPLSLAHGGPLRLVVPGYTGVNNVKYVKRIAFTAAESDARIMSHGYRLSPPGGKGDPSQPSVQEMSVKSWINGPGSDGKPVAAGRVQIHGVAFGGLDPVAKVDVSFDGGRTWNAARFVGPDLGRYAWRQFALSARLDPGRYVMTSRATDAKGRVQPERRLENAGGYNNTSWADHALTVDVA